MVAIRSASKLKKGVSKGLRKRNVLTMGHCLQMYTNDNVKPIGLFDRKNKRLQEY